MHRFALMWLVYSRNKFFRVGPNISEKFVPGGTNFRGVQIKRDIPVLVNQKIKLVWPKGIYFPGPSDQPFLSPWGATTLKSSPSLPAHPPTSSLTCQTRKSRSNAKESYRRPACPRSPDPTHPRSCAKGGARRTSLARTTPTQVPCCVPGREMGWNGEERAAPALVALISACSHPTPF